MLTFPCIIILTVSVCGASPLALPFGVNVKLLFGSVAMVTEWNADSVYVTDNS